MKPGVLTICQLIRICHLHLQLCDLMPKGAVEARAGLRHTVWQKIFYFSPSLLNDTVLKRPWQLTCTEFTQMPSIAPIQGKTERCTWHATRPIVKDQMVGFCKAEGARFSGLLFHTHFLWIWANIRSAGEERSEYFRVYFLCAERCIPYTMCSGVLHNGDMFNEMRFEISFHLWKVPLGNLRFYTNCQQLAVSLICYQTVYDLFKVVLHLCSWYNMK